MASACYPIGKTACMTKLVNLVTDDMSAFLVDTADYTYSAAHSGLSDLSAAAREEGVALAGMAVSGGVFDATDATFTAAAGDGIEAIVIYSATADRLLAYIDLGQTILLNGGDIVVTWDDGANKIFAY